VVEKHRHPDSDDIRAALRTEGMFSNNFYRFAPADGLTRDGAAPTVLMILLLFNPALTGWAKG
jgi:hypothetical protein